MSHSYSNQSKEKHVFISRIVSQVINNIDDDIKIMNIFDEKLNELVSTRKEKETF